MVVLFRTFSLLIEIVLISHVSLSNCQTINPEVQIQIENFIQNVYLPATNTSSLGLTIVQNDGEVLFTTGYGYSDQEKLLMNGNETQFLVGSITKSLTSTVVVKTLSENFTDLGEKVLDTPIRNLIPTSNFTLNDRFRSEQTTFRDLLAHRTCLPTNDLALLAEAFNTSEEIVYHSRYTQETCGIRTRFVYNNEMYVYAGQLIGLIANTSYEQLAQDLMTEIGMLNSTFVKHSDDFSLMPYRAQPYYVISNVSYPTNTGLVKRVSSTIAGGGLFATPNDMAKYMRFQLNLGIIDGKRIIPENVMKWITTPAIVRTPFTFKTSEEGQFISYMGYGLGLNIGSYEGWQHIYHSGHFAPYSALMSLFPEKNLGIFTGSNQGLTLVDVKVVHHFIYDVLSHVANASEKALARLRHEQNLLADGKLGRNDGVTNFLESVKNKEVKNQDNILGQYGSGDLGDVEIFERFNTEKETNGIYLSYGKWAQAWLNNVGEGIYSLEWDSDIVEDGYAQGDMSGGETFARIENGTLEFLSPAGDTLVPLGKFEFGLRFDSLPPIPWAPDSCGPE
ncbi:unnamed protein product [Orchesella dallaii]|uniref:Beta-lactamase-related domain-containing protein n=1 Tax=Orchesella dallaii TaxID=48710 RepID=A0ABP1RJB9_9HEXA